MVFVFMQMRAWTSEMMQTPCSSWDTDSRENKFLQMFFFLRQVGGFSQKNVGKWLDVFLLMRAHSSAGNCQVGLWRMLVSEVSPGVTVLLTAHCPGAEDPGFFRISYWGLGDLRPQMWRWAVLAVLWQVAWTSALAQGFDCGESK